MHRLIPSPLLFCILVGALTTPGNSIAQDKKPLPKKVEFELNLWQARLGLKKIHIRELRFAASNSVAEIKKTIEDADEEDQAFIALQGFETEAEPWVSIPLPRALKTKSFTAVAEAVLNEKQVSNLVAFKKHARQLRSQSMQQSRIHARLGALTKYFYLTESQREKILLLLSTRAKSRQETAEKFKGREDEIPSVKPIRQTPEFRAILDPNQLKLLETKSKD